MIEMNAAPAVQTNPAWAFVKVTAWSMILIGVIGVLMSLMQGFLALTVFNSDMVQYLRESPELGTLPEWAWFPFSHLLAITLFMFMLSLLTVGIAWGLLQRQRWALWLTVGMFWIGSLGNLIGIWLHAVFLHGFRAYAQGFPEWTIRMIEANYWSAQISGAVFGLVFAVGFGWTAWKLGAAATQAEFTQR